MSDRIAIHVRSRSIVTTLLLLASGACADLNLESASSLLGGVGSMLDGVRCNTFLNDPNQEYLVCGSDVRYWVPNFMPPDSESMEREIRARGVDVMSVRHCDAKNGHRLTSGGTFEERTWQGNVCIVGMRAPASKASAAALSGSWKGMYTCGQRATATAISLEGREDGQVIARFRFGPSESNPGATRGEIEMSGVYSADGRLVFEPRRWIKPAMRHPLIGLDGLVRDGVYRGRVTESAEKIFMECSDFAVSRSGA